MVATAPKNTWDAVLHKIEHKVNPTSFSTWFKPTRFVNEDAASLSVRVPNTWFVEWLTNNYLPLIQDVLREMERPKVSVCFLPEEEPARGRVASTTKPEAEQGPAPRWLNSRYSFESFVVSSCNQFAHAAALAMAEQTSSSYNPLFIYGGVGLGKTHLMQAIGNRLGRKPGISLRYISAEHFMNELINAIRFDKTMEFKARYRNVDLLLIDDIQFLAGKERTQEEFFHTFNALHDSDKKIVITSDCPPRDINTLEERLRSRFEWGLIADIQPPDLETKIAILRKKAEAEGIELPDDVALFIATNTKSSVRELEGALIRLIAYGSVSGQEISLELARETLRDMLAASPAKPTVEGIQKFVADQYNLRVTELKSRTNSHHISFPRQIAMYLCKQLTDSSLPEIGRKFGGKHHSTVIHAIQKVTTKRNNEKEFDRMVEGFAQSLG